MESNNEQAILFLQAAGYTVEHFPNRHFGMWRVTFRTSEGLGPSLRLALKRCFWAGGAIFSETANLEAAKARQAAISTMIQLEKPELAPRKRPSE